MLWLGVGYIHAEDWPLGFPTAKPTATNGVPIQSLRKIALRQAKEVWGEVTPGPEIPCRDANGDTLTYMFVFRMGGGRFGKYSEILDRVKTGRKLYEEGVKEMRKLPPSAPPPALTAAGASSGAQQTPPLPPPALQQPSPELLKAQGKFQAGKKMKWGIGEYGTLVVSARNDLIPIPERIHGLPEFFTKLDLLRDKSREVLGGDPRLTGIYYVAPGEQWFEFSSGNNRVLVDPYSMKTSTMKKAVLNRPKKTKRAPPSGAAVSSMKQLVRDEWKKLENGE